MLEDMAAFFEATRRPPRDWKSGLEHWAEVAVAKVAELEACRPGQHGFLQDAAQSLRGHIRGPLGPLDEQCRGDVAILCGYIATAAFDLHTTRIPDWEAAACLAAQELDQAVVQILLTMQDDYGDADTRWPLQ